MMEPSVGRYGFVLIEGRKWTAMNFIETNAYLERAKSCSRRSEMAQDVKIKKFWEDLADEWIVLNECENPRHKEAGSDN
jgi:hypothetical protein